MPDQVIRTSMLRFGRLAMEGGIGYHALMLSSAPGILAMTSVLGEDDVQNRPAMKGLAQEIQRGVDLGLFAPCDAELTAQALWSATFGVLARGMMEKVSPERMDKLLERQADILMKGLMR
jgi:hypothetical protein